MTTDDAPLPNPQKSSIGHEALPDLILDSAARFGSIPRSEMDLGDVMTMSLIYGMFYNLLEKKGKTDGTS